MSDRYTQFGAAFPEEACLDLMMRARHGGGRLTCSACNRVATFVPRPKLRAAVCEHCSFALYPCAGTPFERRRTALQLWFYALRLVAERGEAAAAAAIGRDTAVPSATARRMAAETAALIAAAPDWLAPLRAAILPAAPPAAPASAAGSAVGALIETRAPRPAGPVRLLLLTGLTGLCAAGLLAALIVFSSGRSDERAAAIDAPVLASAPARPSLVLSSVEDDLEAARQATLFALNADPSLADIRPRPPGLDAGQSSQAIPPQIVLPEDVIILPPRPVPPSGRANPLPTLPTAPPPVSGADPNQILSFGPIRIRRHLVETIVRAGRVVGADPTLLMAVADKESSFATDVRAKTSSATGLYQFIEQTWLGVMHEFGRRHGLSAEAALIARSGRQFVVTDPGQRERILDLRREPYLSALLAAEMLKRDTLALERQLGRHLTGGEIYLIHFLGPDAAQTFIETLAESPDAKAADLLPKPAQANRPIFYADAAGETKTLSVSEVHRKFEQMIRLRLDRYRDVRRPAPVTAVKAVQR